MPGLAEIHCMDRCTHPDGCCIYCLSFYYNYPGHTLGES